jgi:hypothetical protein
MWLSLAPTLLVIWDVTAAHSSSNGVSVLSRAAEQFPQRHPDTTAAPMESK